MKEAARRAVSPYNASQSLYDYKIEIDQNKQTPLHSAAYFGPPKLYRLGGEGTDYAVYLHRLGIPSTSAGFWDGGSGYPVYHSIYDNFRWMSKFGDPGFHCHRSMAQVSIQTKIKQCICKWKLITIIYIFILMTIVTIILLDKYDSSLNYVS